MTKPHSDECRERTDELMQRDEDALVQQRLHSDRLRRGSTVVEASVDERRDPDVEMVGSGHENRNGSCEEKWRDPPVWVRRTHANGARRCQNETRFEKTRRITN